MMKTELSQELSSSPQISSGDVADVKAAGFRSILCLRPDGEAPGQPPFSAIATEARQLGLEARYIPIVPGRMGDADIVAFRRAVAELPKPILGYCASGRRVAAAAHAAGLLDRPVTMQNAALNDQAGARPAEH